MVDFHACASALKIVVPRVPWSAVASATAFGSASKAAASLPHSKALCAFSWFLGVPGGTRDCLGQASRKRQRSSPPRKRGSSSQGCGFRFRRNDR